MRCKLCKKENMGLILMGHRLPHPLLGIMGILRAINLTRDSLACLELNPQPSGCNKKAATEFTICIKKKLNKTLIQTIDFVVGKFWNLSSDFDHFLMLNFSVFLCPFYSLWLFFTLYCVDFDLNITHLMRLYQNLFPFRPLSSAFVYCTLALCPVPSKSFVDLPLKLTFSEPSHFFISGDSTRNWQFGP